MYIHGDFRVDADFVRTDEMAYCWNSDQRSFALDLGQMAKDYEIGIEVVSTHPRDAAGWPMVRLSGEREKVRRALIENWGANETEASFQDWTDMLFGDAAAEARWNLGDYDDLPVEYSPEVAARLNAELAGVSVGCELCGSTTEKHYDEMCFK